MDNKSDEEKKRTKLGAPPIIVGRRSSIAAVDEREKIKERDKVLSRQKGGRLSQWGGGEKPAYYRDPGSELRAGQRGGESKNALMI